MCKTLYEFICAKHTLKNSQYRNTMQLLQETCYMHILPLTDFSCANFLHIYPYVCIYIHTHTYVYIYFLSGYLYACLGRSVQGQIEHTHLSAHRVSSPLSTEQQMVYLSTNKIVLKDQAVHFQAKVN